MTKSSNIECVERLGEATRNLSEPEDIMEAVSRIVGQQLSVSRCAYADVEIDNNRFTIYRDYTDNCASTAGSYELSSFGEQAVQLLQRGETLVINDVNEELTSEDGGDMFRAIGIQSIVCCSLVKNHRLVAMMAVHQVDPRYWTEDEIALLLEVVERCWSTIERARAQKVALRNEKKFKDFFEYAPDAQLLLGGDGTIQLMNNRFARMFDLDAAEVIGKPAHELLPNVLVETDSATGAQPSVSAATAMDSGSKLVIENTAGESVYVEISENLVETDEGALRLLSVRDVSQRIRLETELQQIKKIETLGMFAGGIAHDFNNLLTVIIGTAELTLRKDKSDFRFRSEIETIRNVGVRAAELTHKLLAYSRQQVLQPEIIDVNAALCSCHEMIVRLIGENITVRFDLAPGSICANLDQTQLVQVLMNLAANARDAMPDGGSLTFSTKHVSSLPKSLAEKQYSPNGYVRLNVSDSGSGMSEAEVEKIFDPFYTTKGTEKGTGLGLSTVYGIVAQSGGHITVNSRPGEGTRFEIYFPNIPALPESKAENIEGVQSESTKKILIVEDEPELREVLGELLLECGYSSEAAVDGQDALDIFSSKPEYFDLIITDVIMPGMSGPQFIEKAKQLRPDIKVIFSSGYTADAIGRHGVLDRDQNFLSKPYQYEVLEKMVRDVLASRS